MLLYPVARFVSYLHTSVPGVRVASVREHEEGGVVLHEDHPVREFL